MSRVVLMNRAGAQQKIWKPSKVQFSKKAEGILK